MNTRPSVANPTRIPAVRAAALAARAQARATQIAATLVILEYRARQPNPSRLLEPTITVCRRWLTEGQAVISALTFRR